MKANLILLLLVLIANNTAFSQYQGNWQWAEQGNLPNGNHGFGVQIDSSGDIITGGRLGGPGTIYYDTIQFSSNTVYNGFMVKYTPGGQVTWGKKLADSASHLAEVKSFTTDRHGNLFMAGIFSGTIKIGHVTLTNRFTGNGLSNKEVFLVKLDKTGQVQWGKQLACHTIPIPPGTPMVLGGEFGGIATDTAGNCYLSGWFNDTLRIDNIITQRPPAYNLFVAKFNPQGQAQWVTSTSQGSTHYISGLAADAAGNTFVVGDLNYYVDFDTTQLHQGPFICKVNPHGQFEWAHNIGINHYPGNNEVSVNALTADAAGNSYITGKFGDTLHIQQLALTKSSSNWDMYVAKFRPDGTVAWAVNDGGSGTAWGTALTAAGNRLYVGGYFNETAFTGSHALSTPHFQQKSLLVAMLDTAQGQVLSTVQTGYSAAFGHEITAMVADTAGNCYFTGKVGGNLTFGLRQLNQGSYLAKLTFSQITGLPKAKSQVRLSIYPNPASGEFTVSLPELLQDKALLQVFDLQGRLILRQDVAAGAASIPVALPGVAKGCYLVKLQTEKQVWHQKVVVE